MPASISSTPGGGGSSPAALIYNWRRHALAGPAGILPARIVGGDPSTPAGASADSCVRVALASGAKVEVAFGAPPEMVSAILRALR
jgi:hypothetical protein